MPKGPKGERRPADVIGNAVKVMRIATGEETETVPADLTDRVWELSDIVAAMDEVAPKPGPRGPYKKLAENSK